MLKGDASWATHKMTLGWILDTISMTIELPPHRTQRLQQLLDSGQPGQRRIATKQWHRVMGELRSMVVAIPGGKGLFSTLQEAFQDPEQHRHRLRLKKSAHDFLDDWRWLAASLSSRPTRIAELFPTDPLAIGACGASGHGMGGVHFVQLADQSALPLLWRAKFPNAVTKSLVSFDNPSGTISNSDLELAGSLGHVDVLVQAVDMRERTTHNLHDNTPTLYWQRKGSTTTTGPAAYLLRLQSLHQRYHRCVSLHDYIPRPSNVMADLCSRSWHLTNKQLLTHFNTFFPQEMPWQQCHLTNAMLSALTSSLFRTRSDPVLLLSASQHTTITGSDGLTFASNTPSIHNCHNTTIQSPSSRSSLKDVETAELPPMVTSSRLALLRTHCGQWVRNSPAWGPGIRESIHVAKWTFKSLDNLLPTRNLTRPQSGSNQSQSASSFTSFRLVTPSTSQKPVGTSPTSSRWPSTSCYDRGNTPALLKTTTCS